jgi:predicted restriction endonuclease
MTKQGDLITGEVLQVNDRGTTTIKISGETYQLYTHTIRDLGREIVVRILTNDYVALAGYEINAHSEKQGFEGERWAKVTKFNNDGDMLGVINEGDPDGETVNLGKLRCTIGTYVPILYLTNYTEDGLRMTLCTDLSLHTDSYLVSLRESTGVSISDIMSIRKALDNQKNLAKTTLLPDKNNTGRVKDLTDTRPPINNDDYSEFPQTTYTEVNRTSENGNSIASIDGNDLNIGQLHASIGDVIPILPLAQQGPTQKAICTDMELWGTTSYLNHAYSVFQNSDSYSLKEFVEFGATLVRQHANSHVNYNIPSTDYIATHLITESSTTITNEHSTAHSTELQSKSDMHTERTTTTSKETRDVENEPDLTEAQSSYTETRRRARDQTFAKEVKETYDHSCAICEARRVAPNGSVEVEAAHIYPKSKGGVDDVRNGVALCKLHHWAFDNGWISITDTYEINVEHAPDLDGYAEFEPLEGRELNLPEDDALHPHPKFLRGHREIHDFDGE